MIKGHFIVHILSSSVISICFKCEKYSNKRIKNKLRMLIHALYFMHRAWMILELFFPQFFPFKYHVILSYTLLSCVHVLNQWNNIMLGL